MRYTPGMCVPPRAVKWRPTGVYRSNLEVARLGEARRTHLAVVVVVVDLINVGFTTHLATSRLLIYILPWAAILLLSVVRTFPVCILGAPRLA